MTLKCDKKIKIHIHIISFESDFLTGNEDCLFLNVWAPDTNATDLEVMVYIHGGGTQTHLGQLYGAGLLSGSGNEPGECHVGIM